MKTEKHEKKKWEREKNNNIMKKKPIVIDWKELFEAFAEVVIDGKEQKKS